MSPTKLFLGGNNLVIPAQGELVSDIQAGDGNVANLFLQCGYLQYGAGGTQPVGMKMTSRYDVRIRTRRIF
jgi:hypothetical protein